MRALMSEAFVADHRISRVRFAAVAAALALLLAGFVGVMMFGAAGPLIAVGFAAFAAVLVFVGILTVAGGVWWGLWRLRLRGWASSILAGGLLVVLVEGIEWALILGAGARLEGKTDPGTIWIAILYSAPLGMAFGWIIWRFAVRPARAPVDAFE